MHPIPSPKNLPQQTNSWLLVIRELNIWISPPDVEEYHPYGLLIFNLDQGMIRGLELFQYFPTTEEITEVLFANMHQSSPESQEDPHRPHEILFIDEDLGEALSPSLADVEIKAEYHPLEDLVDDVFTDLERMFQADNQIPGLLEQENATPGLIGDLFAAAAEFYRAAPWIHLTNIQFLSVQVEPENEPRYAIIMGNGGVEYGLIMYNRFDDLEHLYTFVDEPGETIPEGGYNSFNYENLTRLPKSDLKATEQYGWEIAGEDAYPLPLVFLEDYEVKRPDRDALLWYEAALRAIPKFVPEYLEDDGRGDYEPTEAEFDVSTHTGRVKVKVGYPSNQAIRESLPAEIKFGDEDEWEDETLPFDRRAMESSLTPFGSSFEDPDDQEAQSVMYQAWDEPNPAKRINLAYKALSISPNNADAWVLLAEEEADTKTRALKFYQNGVDAGERALGPQYFGEHVGYFWGILETRPYMRARAGLANILWSLGRTEEAAEHYRDMLRLNPGDNQGIRFSLLNLLLEIKDYDAAEALLAQEEYVDSAMAEWVYTQALMEFRKNGDTPQAREYLEEGMRWNIHVPKYLTGRKRIPNYLPDSLILGGESEAVHYASSYLNHWRKVFGAIKWLKEQT